jgi:hypothetical protein
MGAIWHDIKLPSFLGVPPSYSFLDISEIIAPAPESYAEARQRIQRWERKLGAAWYTHNAELAHQFYIAKRPWWLGVC